MAENSFIGISGSMDNSDIDNSINELVKKINTGVNSIALSMQKMITKMETGFDGVAKSANTMSTTMETSFGNVTKSLQGLITVGGELNKAFRDGTFKQMGGDMAITSQQTEQLIERLSGVKEAYNKISGGEKAMSSNGALEFSYIDPKSLDITQIEGYLKKAEEARKIFRESGETGMFKEITEKIKAAQLIFADFNKETKNVGTKEIRDYDSVMNMATNSISDHITKKKALIDIQSQLNKNDKDYEYKLRNVTNQIEYQSKAIDKLKGKKVKGATSSMSFAQAERMSITSPEDMPISGIESFIKEAKKAKEIASTLRLDDMWVTLAHKIDIAENRLKAFRNAQKEAAGLSSGGKTTMTVQDAERFFITDTDTLRDQELENYIKKAQEARRVLAENNGTDNMFEKISVSIEKAKDRLKTFNDNAKKIAIGSGTDFDSAMAMSSNSINDRTAKIKVLTEVQRNLNTTLPENQQKLKAVNKEIFDLDEANKRAAKSGVNLQKQTQKMGVTVEALTRRLAYYFSVGAIVNFAKNLVNIRGEFELQNRALGAIIQNKGEADRLFSRITALAVISPFQLSELIGYTKQLSAYRIETEKLYDTTKMLADVSAGLGVDMNRLILAYGQIRSAAVLRGQELRQMTEAGIPIIDLLAKKFSELEGRVVSTGEVFERVSNRMVPFKMVDQMFKDMTQSGGLFYQMQEIQAETMKGKISNLVDAYQIMLNKIGTSQQNALTAGIDSIRSLIDNYDDYTVTLTSVLVVLGLYKTMMFGLAKANLTFGSSLMDLKRVMVVVRQEARAAASLGFFGNLFKNLRIGVIGFTLALKSAGVALMSFLPYAIALAVIQLAQNLYSAATAASKLRGELNNISQEGLLEADKMAKRFKVLAETALGAADGSEKQNEALRKLGTQYRDLLPAQTLTIDGLKALQGRYESTTAAIYDKVKAQQAEAGVSHIATELEPDVKKNFDEIKREFVNLGADVDIADETIKEFRKRVEGGLRIDTSKGIAGVYKELFNIYKEIAGGGFTGEPKGGLNFGDTYTTDAKQYYESVVKVIDANKELTKILDDQFKLFGKYNSRFKQAQSAATASGNEREYLLSWAASLGVSTKEELEKAIKEGTSIKVDDVAFINVFDAIRKQISSTVEKMTGFQRSVGGIIMSISELSPEIRNMTAEKLEGKSVDEFAKGLNDELKAYKETIDQVTAVKSKAVSGTLEEARATEYLNDVQQKYNNTLIILTKTGLLKQEKEKGKGKNKELDNLKEMISLFSELRSEFEKLGDAGFKGSEIDSILNGQFSKKVSQFFPDYTVQTLAGSNPKQAADILSAVNQNLKTNEAKNELDLVVSKLNLEFSSDAKRNLNKEINNELSKIQKDYESGVEVKGMGESGKLFAELFDLTPISIKEAISKANKLISEKTGVSGVEGMNMLQLSTTIGIKDTSDLYKELDEVFKFRNNLQKDDYKSNVEWQAKLLEKYSDFTFRKREIDRTALEEQAALDELYANKKDSAEYKRLTESIRRKKEQETTALAFDEFKSSDEWVMAFENLEDVSSTAIATMIEKLRAFKSEQKNFSPTEMREYSNTLKKLEEQLTNRQPFLQFLSSIKELGIASKAVESAKKSAGFKGSDEEFALQATNAIVAAEKNISIERAKGADANYDIIKSNEETISQQRGILSLVNDEQSKRSKLSKSINESAKMAGALMSSAMGALSDLGVTFDADTQKRIDGVGKVFEGLESIDLKNPISILTGGIKVIGGLISAIFGDGGESKIVAEIESSERAVKRLKWAYEDLGKEIDRALGDDKFKVVKLQLENISKQTAQLSRQIALEKKRKDPDRSRIEELTQQYKELDNQILDTLRNLKEEILGITSSDVTQNLANALKEAFSQGTNAAEAWGKSVEDIINNMVYSMLVAKLLTPKITAEMDRYWNELMPKTVEAQNLAKKVTDFDTQISELEGRLTENNGFLSGERMIYENRLKNLIKQREDAVRQRDKAVSLAEGEIPNATEQGADVLQKGLEGIGSWFDGLIPDWLKERFMDSADEKLSGLAKGIQGIQENTALQLEALFNSFLYQSYIQTATQKDIVKFSEMTSINTSQLLLYAQQSYQVLLSIQRWTQSITGSGHNKYGGAFIKVEI